MPIAAQGTDLFILDPDTHEVLDTMCINSIDGISSPADQVETTCLQETSRTYQPGLKTPGSATIEVYYDPQSQIHNRIHELYRDGKTVKWAVGFSDGKSEPTSTETSGEYDFDLPEDRSWLTFEGYISDFPFSFAQNSMVTSSLSVQISGEILPVPKVLESA